VRSATTTTAGRLTLSTTNFNPRAPCGARHGKYGEISVAIKISIHALRAERDLYDAYDAYDEISISIHALRAERDSGPERVVICLVKFQSTRSERSATFPFRIIADGYEDFNPRAPSGARHETELNDIFWFEFQSTRSERSATS